MEFERIMIIVWRWSDLDVQLQDAVQVKNSPTDLIIRISDRNSAKDRILEAIKTYSKADIFIFLHRGEGHFFNQKDVHAILKESSNDHQAIDQMFFVRRRLRFHLLRSRKMWSIRPLRWVSG